MLMEALQCAEKEGLISERAHVLMAGVNVMLKSGQKEMALEWATRSREAFELLEGPDSFYTKRAKEQEKAVEAKMKEGK